MQGLVTEESLAWFMWGKGSCAALKSWALELDLVLTATVSLQAEWGTLSHNSFSVVKV